MFNPFFIFNMWKFQVDGEEEVQLYVRRVNSEMVLNFFNNLEGENIFSFVFLFVDMVEIYT